MLGRHVDLRRVCGRTGDDGRSRSRLIFDTGREGTMSSIRSVSPDSPDRGPGRQDQSVRQLVGFRLDNADYAIAITMIREIILMKPITRLPQVPPSIEGLINLRGTVIPIVNLRKRFGLAARKASVIP